MQPQAGTLTIACVLVLVCVRVCACAAVSVCIMQRTGAGIHCAKACFWDTVSDGQQQHTRTRHPPRARARRARKPANERATQGEQQRIEGSDTSAAFSRWIAFPCCLLLARSRARCQLPSPSPGRNGKSRTPTIERWCASSRCSPCHSIRREYERHDTHTRTGGADPLPPLCQCSPCSTSLCCIVPDVRLAYCFHTFEFMFQPWASIHVIMCKLMIKPPALMITIRSRCTHVHRDRYRARERARDHEVERWPWRSRSKFFVILPLHRKLPWCILAAMATFDKAPAVASARAFTIRISRNL